MFSDERWDHRASVARFALMALLGAVVGCHEQIVVGTEPSEAPGAALPRASDAGPADVAAPPDAEDDADDENDDADDDDTDDDGADDDAESDADDAEGAPDEDTQDEDAQDDTGDSQDEE